MDARKSGNDQDRHPCLLAPLLQPNCIKPGRAGSGLREGLGERVTGKQGRACNRLEGEYVARVTALEGWNEHRPRGGAPGPPLPAV